MQQDHQPQVEFLADAGPNWSAVRALAAAQEGHFTVAQAVTRGFSEQLLSKHAAAGNLERPLRGIYRLAHFPPGEHEDLVVAWLWSGEQGVVSHETALQLHALSDAMPSRIHLTLPAGQRTRRRVVPPLYVLHYADVPAKDRIWMDAVPVTTATRTVLDVAASHGDAAIVKQAIDEGINRRMFSVWDVVPAVEYAHGLAR